MVKKGQRISLCTPEKLSHYIKELCVDLDLKETWELLNQSSSYSTVGIWNKLSLKFPGSYACQSRLKKNYYTLFHNKKQLVYNILFPDEHEKIESDIELASIINKISIEESTKKNSNKSNKPLEADTKQNITDFQKELSLIKSIDTKICVNNSESDHIYNNEVNKINIFAENNIFPPGFPQCEKKLFGINLDTTCFKSLQENTWVNDEIIDVFFLLLKYHAKETKDVKLLPFPSFVVKSFLDLHSKINYLEWAEATELWKQHVWLLPLNVNNMHYTLLIIISSLQLMIYIDSASGRIPRRFLSAVCSFINCVPNMTDKINWSQWRVYKPPDIPSQYEFSRKSGNCGSHTMSWGYILGTGMVFDFTEKNMNNVRKGIVNILLNSSSSKEQEQENTKLIKILLKETSKDIQQSIVDLKIEKKVPMNASSTLAFIASLSHKFKN